MHYLTVVAIFLTLATITLQQPPTPSPQRSQGQSQGKGGQSQGKGGQGGKGGNGDRGHGQGASHGQGRGVQNQDACYDPCYAAYQSDQTNYAVAGCTCTTFRFPGSRGRDHEHDNTCLRYDRTCKATAGAADSGEAYVYDGHSKACVAITVYTRCTTSYGTTNNFYQTQADCTTACVKAT